MKIYKDNQEYLSNQKPIQLSFKNFQLNKDPFQYSPYKNKPSLSIQFTDRSFQMNHNNDQRDLFNNQREDFTKDLLKSLRNEFEIADMEELKPRMLTPSSIKSIFHFLKECCLLENQIEYIRNLIIDKIKIEDLFNKMARGKGKVNEQRFQQFLARFELQVNKRCALKLFKRFVKGKEMRQRYLTSLQEFSNLFEPRNRVYIEKKSKIKVQKKISQMLYLYMQQEYFLMEINSLIGSPQLYDQLFLYYFGTQTVKLNTFVQSIKFYTVIISDEGSSIDSKLCELLYLRLKGPGLFSSQNFRKSLID